MASLAHFGHWAIIKYEDFRDACIMLGLSIQSIFFNGLKALPLISRIVIRQFKFTAIDALFLLTLIGIFFGYVVISQFYASLNAFLPEKMLSRIIIVFVFREFGPLLVALLLIGRSASAITVELANLRVNNQIELLEASGIDIIHLMVFPRIIAMIFSCLILTAVFNVFTFMGGIGLSKMTGVLTLSYNFGTILEYITRDDVLIFLFKPIAFGFVIAFSACFYGINRAINVNYIPKAATWAIVHAILFCFILNIIFMQIFPAKF